MHRHAAILVVKYSDVYHPHSYVCLLERFLFEYDLLSLLHSTEYITGKHACMSFDAAFLLSRKRLEAEANHAIINLCDVWELDPADRISEGWGSRLNAERHAPQG